ncbi:alpha/beta hydrolase [Kordiimonas sp. SCSIO 12603]|uniref:alpha/beta fold hydrolase n=1 Tax=Kordiimonas sp. SCSIO 12603 TaxID=2829596 RepID=UPI0021072621|nr:alpha/beta hydrolase [Kordiimonas sp. SCSIO 12603]UTW59150.1 alpha/beta hydrolase [Kordiimonas sp. SCSIO 12603]
MTDTSWFYKELGASENTIHWLHGWGTSHTSFSRMAELFKKDASNRLYDLPGFGNTPALSEDAGTFEYSEAFIKQLDPSQSHIIIGHSYGGRVAIQLAAKYPDRIKAIILVAGAGLQRKRSLKFKTRAFLLRTLGKLARFSDSLFKTSFREAYTNKFGSTDYKNAGVLRQTLVKAVTEDLSPQAREVRCPTLLVYGSEDADTPPEIGRKYERLIPLARYEELSGYDHHDILSRGAYQCEALIKAFLKDIENA